MKIPEQYLERIRALYPSLKIETLDYNRDGMVNEVVVVNGELVCRFVKEDWGRPLLAAEARALALLRERVEVAIPEFEHLEDDFCTYRFLRGEPLTRNALLRMRPEDRAGLLRQLGGFVSGMHRIPAEELGGIPPSDTARGRDDWLRLYQGVREHLYPHLYRHQHTWVEELFAPLLEDKLDLGHPPTLVNGDLAVYHLLYDPQTRRLSGVIDFGTAGVGHPAVDIATLLCQYGETLTRQTGCENLEALLPYARFWAGTLELQWALAGVRRGDLGLAVAHIGGARDVGVD